MRECKGCAERREKLKAHMQALLEWAKNPRGAPDPSSLKRPTPPQIHTRPIISKKDISP
jgi:hypothetical protein